MSGGALHASTRRSQTSDSAPVLKYATWPIVGKQDVIGKTGLSARREIGWKEHLQNGLILCRVRH